MKCYRWMCLAEFEKMSAGCTISAQKGMNAKTTGSGVFFLPEDYSERIVGNCWEEDGEPIDYSMSPEESIRFLSGIVTDDVMVEFVVNTTVSEAHGIYADPVNLDWYATISVPELCCSSYNRDMMIPVRYFIPEKYSMGEGDWYEFN